MDNPSIPDPYFMTAVWSIFSRQACINYSEHSRQIYYIKKVNWFQIHYNCFCFAVWCLLVVFHPGALSMVIAVEGYVKYNHGKCKGNKLWQLVTSWKFVFNKWGCIDHSYYRVHEHSTFKSINHIKSYTHIKHICMTSVYFVTYDTCPLPVGSRYSNLHKKRLSRPTHIRHNRLKTHLSTWWNVSIKIMNYSFLHWNLHLWVSMNDFCTCWNQSLRNIPGYA